MGRNGSKGFPRRHRWVASVLERTGARVEGDEEGVFTCALTGDLSRFLGREAVRITFQKRTAQNGAADLATPGSWFHDQLLRFSRERGNVARGWLEPIAGLEPTALLESRREGAALLMRCERRYGILAVFTFRLAYYSDPAEEEILHVGYDAERGRAVRRSLTRLVEAVQSREGDNGFAPAPPVDMARAFHAAWEVVENVVESRVRLLAEHGRPAYEQRIRTVESYYRQLLAEEKRLLESRASRKGQDESRGRIDLLKVEWERRMKEEAERLRPQVVAVLSAIAFLHLPLERWRFRGPTRGEIGGEVWLDLTRGEVWDVANGGGPCVAGRPKGGG